MTNTDKDKVREKKEFELFQKWCAENDGYFDPMHMAWAAWQGRAALSTVPEAALPRWKMVPIEPTAAMVDAGITYEPWSSYTAVRNVYRAMLYAAPIAQPVEKPADNMIAVARRNLRSFLSNAGFALEVDRQAALNCLEVLESAVVCAQPVEQEPFAWFMPDDNGFPFKTTGYGTEAYQWASRGHKVLPLFAAPVSAEAIRREALEEATEVCQSVIDDESIALADEAPTCARRIRALASQPAQESGK